MRKIAVIFPGVGYTKDRPLLYYSGKLAVSLGYELKHLDFSGLNWSKEKLKDRAFLMQTLDRCMHITEKEFNNMGDMSDSKVVFISKSIGTVVAAAYARNKSLDVRQICFSPLEMIGDYVADEEAVLFCGDDDPYADFTLVEKTAEEKELEIHRIKGGNHSLETGDIYKDIDNLETMMKRVEDIIK